MKVFYNDVPFEKLTTEMNITSFNLLNELHESIKDIQCDNDSQGLELHYYEEHKRTELMYSYGMPRHLKEEANEKLSMDNLPTLPI